LSPDFAFFFSRAISAIARSVGTGSRPAGCFQEADPTGVDVEEQPGGIRRGPGEGVDRRQKCLERGERTRSQVVQSNDGSLVVLAHGPQPQSLTSDATLDHNSYLGPTEQ